MKNIISIICGIFILILGFWLDAKFINWCISHLFNSQSNLALLVKIGLWIVTFDIIVDLSAWMGILVGGLFDKYNNKINKKI